MASGDPPGDAALPIGPHPTLGPDTPVPPRWPGPLLITLGLITGITGIFLGEVVAAGQADVSRGVLLTLGIGGAIAFGAGLSWSAERAIRQRSVLAPDRYRGPAVIVLLAMVLLIGTVVVAPFGADALALVSGEGTITLLGAMVILLSTPAALLGVAWLFVARPNALAALPAFPGRDAGRALASGAGWGVLAWIGSSALLVIIAWLLDQVGMAPQPEAAQQAIAVLDPWLIVLAIVIAAPIAEETFFRGIVFNAWLREGGRRYAFLGSAALFAVIHLSLVSLVPIFALGLVLAWVYERNGRNLLAPMAMHAVVNGLSVAIALADRFGLLNLSV